MHVTDNLQLGPRTYAILVKGVEVARGEIYPDRFLAINQGSASTPVEGVATHEPAFGLPAWWIAADRREGATMAGYTVVDPTTALSTHLSETIRTFLPELLGRQQTKELVDRVGQTSPRLIEELVPKLVSIGEIQRVLRQLLRERVPIRDLTTILEAIGDAVGVAGASKDTESVTEAVRTTMGRAICRPFQNERGELPTISLAPALEAQLVSAIVRTEQGMVLALDPTNAQRLATRVAEALSGALAQPVLLCTPTLRPHLWRLLTRVLPSVSFAQRSAASPQLASVAVLD